MPADVDEPPTTRNGSAPEAARRVAALDPAVRATVGAAVDPLTLGAREVVRVLRELADEVEREVERITRAQSRLFGEDVAPGEVSHAQLTTQEVEAIKRLLVDVVDPKAIAETYRLSFATVLRIASGELFDEVAPWKVTSAIVELARFRALATYDGPPRVFDARTVRAAVSHRVLVPMPSGENVISKAWRAFATMKTNASEPGAKDATGTARTTRRKRTKPC